METEGERDNRPIPYAVPPPAINNALAYKSPSHPCAFEHVYVFGSFISVLITRPRNRFLSVHRVTFLSVANSLSLPRSGFPAFALAAGQPGRGTRREEYSRGRETDGERAYEKMPGEQESENAWQGERERERGRDF